MVVLGGMGSFTGSVISTITLTVVPEILRAFADYRMIIYSVILVIVMIFRPQGLMGREEFSISRQIARFKRKIKKEGANNG